jgi:hypothetical protein
LEFLHEKITSRALLKVIGAGCRFKRLKINLESKNTNYMAKIGHQEKGLLEQLMNGVSNEECSIEETPCEKEDRDCADQEEEFKNAQRTSTVLKEAREMPEAERTKKKKKKNKNNEHSRNEFLEKTPKLDKSFNYINLQPGLISPMGLGMFGKDDNREEKLFNPCVLQAPMEASMLSPSKMLSLESPAPRSFSLFDVRIVPMTRMTFGP